MYLLLRISWYISLHFLVFVKIQILLGILLYD